MYIDLFAGCGGLSLGLQKAGWNGLFAVEKNVDAYSTLEHNLGKHFSWPEWLPKQNLDINILLEDYEKQLENLNGKVDLVVGGPPCQGFSMAGKRTGTDIRNRLYNSYIKFVRLVQPQMILFENVHGFAVGFKRKYKGKEIKGEPYSLKLVRELKKIGYKVSYEMITFSDFGVPQKRKRFILFATKSGDPDIFFEKLKENKSTFLAEKGLNESTTIEDAISDLRKACGETRCSDSPRFQTGLYGQAESAYQNYMRKNICNTNIPDSHRFANQKDKTINLLAEIMRVTEEPNRITPKMGLVPNLKKRGITPLKKGCVCPTITSIPDDLIHYSEPRIMTVRECARIQSFPDDYIFIGKYTTGGSRRKVEVPRYTQVANAVPPLFAEQAGKVLLELKELYR